MGLVARLLSVDGSLVYLIVGLLVFAEDALFVGFVLPGETAAVLGGADAGRGHVAVAGVAAVVVVAAVAGDSVGYEVGRRAGPRVLSSRPLRRHSHRLDDAQDFLARRGGPAVLLARFVAFFRAVMPALAGSSGLRYRTFLAFNAAGGLLWGIGFVLAGYLAGSSYVRVERTAGRGAAVAVVAVLVLAFAVRRLRPGRRGHAARDDEDTGPRADSRADSRADAGPEPGGADRRRDV